MYKSIIYEKVISFSCYLNNIATPNHLGFLKNEDSLVEYIPFLKKKPARYDNNRIQKTLIDFSVSRIIHCYDLAFYEVILSKIKALKII
ncbi:hypothetical protein MHTCC0001_08530 [Flavobacteriaceae bacterium MHTCC 0001]